LTERRDIGWRLENWAHCVGAGAHKPGITRLGKDLDRMRKETEGSSSSSDDRRRVDKADADRIERVMRTLETQHRMMLYWCYIRALPPEVVCRKMRIPHHPATEFVKQFRAAQRAVELLEQQQTCDAGKQQTD